MNSYRNLFFILLIVTQSCTLTNTNGDESLTNYDQSKLNKLDSLLNKETVREIIKAIPNPLELTSAIKMSGAVYDQDILHDPIKSDDYSTSFKKALNLGVFGADLAYINVYERSKSSTSYLEAIKSISTELRIGQFFDFQKMRDLASNKDNIDSLINIVGYSFEKMDNYLNDNNRSNVSGLILAGGWIEALYIATSVYNRIEVAKGKELMERIGEQKIVLEDLIFLLSMYRGEPQFDKLIMELGNLKTTYEGVTIDYIYMEPERKEVDGALVIIDNSRSEVIMSESTMNKIIEQVQFVRKAITI